MTWYKLYLLIGEGSLHKLFLSQPALLTSWSNTKGHKKFTPVLGETSFFFFILIVSICKGIQKT